MKTQTHLKPGQKGTKRLVEQYGDSLLCVRYRYDEKRGVRLKTFELVVEEKSVKPASLYHDDDIVAVVVAYTETSLRDKLKTAGGRWCPEEEFWHGNIYGTSMGSGLTFRTSMGSGLTFRYLLLNYRHAS